MPHVKSQVSTAPTRAIRLPQVIELTGMSRPTIWRKARAGEFPKSFKLSAAITCWDEVEVRNWIAEKMATRAA